jgi:Xaa-Pro aminopeptidase
MRYEFYKEYFDKYKERTEMESVSRSEDMQQIILKPGMVFEFENHACIGRHLVNVGSTVLMTETGPEELNEMGTRMRIAGEL